MDFFEYKNNIDRWHSLLQEAAIVDSKGNTLPITFWKTFLGIKRKAHQDMYKGTYKTKNISVPEYISRSIHFINLLPKRQFLKEVKQSIKNFEDDKSS